jgi:hypothetical protein
LAQAESSVTIRVTNCCRVTPPTLSVGLNQRTWPEEVGANDRRFVAAASEPKYVERSSWRPWVNWAVVIE